MVITYKITTDVMNKAVPPIIDAVQGEVNTRKIEVEILANGTELSIPEDANICVRFGKPDKTGGVYDTLPDGTKAFEVNDNIVSVIIAPQLMTVAGMVLAQIAISSKTETIATFTFKIRVEADPSVGTLKSESYFNLIEFATNEIEANSDKIYKELAALFEATYGTPRQIWVVTNKDSASLCENGYFLDDLTIKGSVAQADEKTLNVGDLIIASDGGILFIDEVIDDGTGSAYGLHTVPFLGATTDECLEGPLIEFVKKGELTIPNIWLAPNLDSNSAYLDGVAFSSLIGAKPPNENNVQENDVIICGLDLGFLYVNRITDLWGGSKGVLVKLGVDSNGAVYSDASGYDMGAIDIKKATKNGIWVETANGTPYIIDVDENGSVRSAPYT